MEEVPQQRYPHPDAEIDPVRVDPDGFNQRVSQLRETERERGDDAALSVTVGEAVVAVDIKEPKSATE